MAETLDVVYPQTRFRLCGCEPTTTDIRLSKVRFARGLSSYNISQILILVSIVVALALPSIVVPSPSSATELVVLSDDRRYISLTCTARSFPGRPTIVWSTKAAAHNYTANVTDYTGHDGANYLTSRLLVHLVGEYQCLLRQSRDRITFAVVGESSSCLIHTLTDVHRDCLS